MSKDFEVHLSLTLNFSYETETLRQINYRVLGKGCIISRIVLPIHLRVGGLLEIDKQISLEQNRVDTAHSSRRRP